MAPPVKRTTRKKPVSRKKRLNLSDSLLKSYSQLLVIAICTTLIATNLIAGAAIGWFALSRYDAQLRRIERLAVGIAQTRVDVQGYKKFADHKLKELSAKTSSRWTSNQMSDWCEVFEEKNKELGVVCPPPYSVQKD